MKLQKIYKITNQNKSQYFFYAETVEEAMNKFYNLFKEKEEYEKNIISVEFINYIFVD